MPSLHALSAVLHRMILDYVSVDAGTQRRLLLTCKTFQFIAEPTLYRRVKLVPTPSWPKLSTKCPVALFYCTVRGNNKLAELVREISIDGSGAQISCVWNNSDDDDQYSFRKDVWLAKMLPDALARMHTLGGREFYQIIRPDLVIGLLLLRLKNLESFRLHYMFWEREPYLPGALYKKYLKKLKIVWLETGQCRIYQSVSENLREVLAPKPIDILRFTKRPGTLGD